ncbi:MAG: hypothetical protein ACKVIW_03160, partial [bacterium]
MLSVSLVLFLSIPACISPDESSTYETAADVRDTITPDQLFSALMDPRRAHTYLLDATTRRHNIDLLPVARIS